VKQLFAALDLGRKELSEVQLKVQEQNWPGACETLIDFYREGHSASWLRLGVVEPSDRRDLSADPILNDTFTIQRISARQPRLDEERLDWNHNGPRGDREWGWLLNRHSYFNILLNAWQKTGNPVYTGCFDRHIRDWVVSNPPPGRDVGTATWRVLEVGLRLQGAWPRAFYGFQQSDQFSAAGRILMLSSIPDHADHCMRFHAEGGNHLLMEMYGLANAATCRPQFKEGEKWFDYARSHMLPEIRRQVYPDGVQKELTSHYHYVSLVNFERFADLVQQAGRDLPSRFLEGVERMWNYVAFSMRPDWTWIATNGREGEHPSEPPSAAWLTPLIK